MQGASLFEEGYYGACVCACNETVVLSRQYPMLCLEAVLHNKSDEQIAGDALKSYSRSVSDARYEKFYRAWRAAMRLRKGGQIADADAKLRPLLKTMLDHYARELWCNLIKADPLTYEWNEIAIEYTSPIDLRDTTEEEREQIVEFAKSRLQPFFEASIRYLDSDVQ